MVWSTRAATFAAASIVAGVATVSALVGPAVADDRSNLEQQRNGVAGRVGGAEKDLEASSKAFAKANNALKSAKEQLGSAQAHLGQTRQALSGAKALDATLKVK